MRVLKLFVIAAAAAAILSGILFATGLNNALIDWWALHNYTPPANIAALSADTTMTPYATKLFYLNHPQLQSSADFNENCPAGGEKTIVLGCYHSRQGGIFIYSVSDKELHGVEQVTAAHEMLHAAYDRLSAKDKKYVNGLLQQYYTTRLRDPTIRTEIAAYQKSEPKDVVNEMHSIFGTEVANLPGPLEQYYRHYFVHRKIVAQFAASYRSAFTKREAIIKQYDAQLRSLKNEINMDESTLQTELSEINSMQSTLDAERSAGDNAAYNRGVAPYNSLVDTYNSLVDQVRYRIYLFNTLVVKRNAIALQENKLARELNSSAEPISQ